MLEVDGLSGGYGRLTVLWDISLRVEARQIVALVGPNGAGKSTLLRTLSGMVPPRGGSFRLHGRELAGLPAEKIARVGVSHVPEGRRMFFGLSVRDNLTLGAWRTGRRPDLEPVLELFPKLADRLDQIVGTMSGGEQQMCAIARGLVGRPDLIMIDELSLGLAPIVVDEIMDRLPDIAAAGTGVLLVEQDVEAALGTAEYGYVIESGRIALSGPSGQLLTDSRVQESYLGQV